MRALIVAFGSHGDVLPLIAIGAELRRRGHEVVFGCAEPFRAMATKAGLEFEALASAEDYEAATRDASLWRPIRGVERLFGYVELGIRPALDFLRRRAVRGRTVVVASTLAIGARLGNDVLKLPVVTVHMAPLQIQSRNQAPRLPYVPPFDWLPRKLKWDIQLWVDDHVIDRLVTPKLNAVRAEYGRPPVRRLRHWWHAPRRTLLMCPAWFVPRQPDWPDQIRQTDFPVSDVYGEPSRSLEPEVERFLSGGEKVVVVTLGSAMNEGGALYRTVIEGALRAGRRCLVLTSIALELPAEAAGKVLVTRYAPLSLVTPRCAVLVHHGGVGTIGRALAGAVPQLIIPIAFDHFDNAARLRRLGCGLVASRYLLGPGRVARLIKKLAASSQIAASCRKFAELAGNDGVAAACDEIEMTFKGWRRPRPTET